MSRRTSIEGIIWMTIRIILGLTFGLAIYLLIRCIPNERRFMVEANHWAIPWLEKKLQKLFGPQVKLFHSPSTTITASALFWTGFWLSALSLGSLLAVHLPGPYNRTRLICLAVAAVPTAGLLGWSAGKEYVAERDLQRRLTAYTLPGDLPPDTRTDRELRYNRISVAMRIRITLPYQTAFNPTANLQLLTTLRGLEALFDLEVIASHRGITFEIVADNSKVQQVKSVVRATFPEASLSYVDNRKRDALMDLIPTATHSYAVTAQPGKHCAPVKPLSEFRRIDPLAPLLQSLAGLRPDETVAIQCLLRPAQFPDWKQSWVNQVTKDTSTLRDFLTFSGALAALGEAMSRQPEFKPETAEHRAYMAKLEQPLFEALVSVFIKAPDPARARVLSDGIRSAFAQFETSYNSLSLSPLRFYSKKWPWRFTWSLSDNSNVLVLTADELASIWHLPSELIRVPGVLATMPKTVPPPRQPEKVGAGVVIGESIYQDVRKPVVLSDQDRDGHINIVGMTGTGKTTFMHHVIHQDIQAGKGLAIVDPHGDLFKRVLRSSIPPEREEDVIVFDLASPEDHVPLGLFDLPEGASKDRATVEFMQVFELMFERKWPTRQTRHVISYAVRALLDHEGAMLSDIPRLFYDQVFRRNLALRVTHKHTRDFWQFRFESLSQSEKSRYINPVLNRLAEFVGSPVVEHITCKPKSLDLEKIISEGKILLVSLRSNEVTDTQRQTLAQLLVSKLQMASWSRADLPFEERELFFITVDEVQQFTATSLPQMFAGIRKNGISLQAANQYLGQLTGDTLGAVFGNVGTTVIFEVGVKDAQALSPYVKPIFDASDLTHLGKFNAVVRTRFAGRSQSPFSIMIPGPMAEPADADEREARIRQSSRSKYALPPRPERDEEDPLPELSPSGGYYD